MEGKKSAAKRLATRTQGMEGAVRRPSRRVLARLKAWDPRYRGQVAAIEMESEEIFLGQDVVEATLKGWEKYPGRAFYFVRIGYPAVHSRRGGLRLYQDGESPPVSDLMGRKIISSPWSLNR
ncbi:MAG: hypothetical protein NZ578_17900 [Candidatus Binatia bacterium]|nr:hypothetical protein [Candidatus Binatia bacterium]